MQTNFLGTSQTFIPCQIYWKCAGPSVSSSWWFAASTTYFCSSLSLFWRIIHPQGICFGFLSYRNSWYVLSTSSKQLFHLSWFFIPFLCLITTYMYLIFNTSVSFFHILDYQLLKNQQWTISFSFFGCRICLGRL